MKANDLIMWGITEQNKNHVIGTIVLWHIDNEQHIAEIGYELHPDYHHKGIMKEALQEVINFGFYMMDLNTITAYTHAQNEASVSLLKHNNFKRDYNLEAAAVGVTEPQTTIIYTLRNIFL